MKRIIALLLFAVTASAQTFDAGARAKAVETVAQLLETMYVIPETGRALAAKIRAGSYDSATTPAALADAIQRELATANDRHLSLRYDPGSTGSQPVEGGMRRVRRAESPSNQGHSFRRVERLEGNIGYLDVGGFSPGDDARAAVDAAMKFLEGSDAMIVDVRRCPGGAVEGVNYLASYFFGPERRVLMNRYNRPSNESTESTTTDLAGKRMPDTDLYVLTSNRSGSACESFPFTLQQYGRAKIVGERTAGAGYNNAIVPVGHGLRLSVSVGTATHPKTGKGWEAVGVEPDIAASADRALEVARAEALKKLGRAVPASNAIDEVRRVEREWLDAYEQRDSAAMQRIVADDFTIVFPSGSSQTKADILSMLERGRAANRPSPKFSTEDVQARAYGDTVILSGRVLTNGADASRYTDTYVRRDGRWQVVASHLSQSAAGSRPPAVEKPAAAPTRIEDYVGTYGVRTVSVRDGALQYQRTGGPEVILRQLERDKYAIETAGTVTFLRNADGTVRAIRLEWTDGRPAEEIARDR
jgi:retinol-binding protein 3